MYSITIGYLKSYFSQWLTRVKSGEKFEQRDGRKVGESQGPHVFPKGERYQLPAKTLPVGHSLTVIHRLIEMD